MDNTVEGSVEGGIAALPALVVAEQGAVPAGWSQHEIDGIKFAVPASWGDSIDGTDVADQLAWARTEYPDWNLREDQFSVVGLAPTTGSVWGESYFLGLVYSDTVFSLEGAWFIPADSVSWRIDVPQAGLVGADVYVVSDLMTTHVVMMTPAGAYCDLYFRASPDDAGRALGEQFMASLTII